MNPLGSDYFDQYTWSKVYTFFRKPDICPKKVSNFKTKEKKKAKVTHGARKKVETSEKELGLKYEMEFVVSVFAIGCVCAA